MTYGDFKDLNRGTIVDKVLQDINIQQRSIFPKIQNMMDINKDLFQWSMIFFGK